ncbi:F-box only protein 39-like [Leptinotarsa decemlineata]|uniref:F-box only protein 39-like n=1 Tax=Leptinotarsa decemlineata TaxID=7539 RepID=UPI003D30A9F4
MGQICSALIFTVKKPKEKEEFSGWAHLPSVVLFEIFDYLDAKDRLNASVVCRTWSEIYFHPRFWPSLKFSFTPKKLDEARMLTNLFGRTITKATVTLNTTSKHCLRAFTQLLQHLEENNNLKSLFIYPDPRIFETPAKLVHRQRVKLVDITEELLDSLKKCLPKLDEFTMGCGPNLPSCSLDHLLTSLNTSVINIGLCSFDKMWSELPFNPAHLRRFSKLQVLRINLSQVSEDVIMVLQHAEALQKIIIHVDKSILHIRKFKEFQRLKSRQGKRVSIIFKFWWWLDYNEQNTDVLDSDIGFVLSPEE